MNLKLIKMIDGKELIGEIKAYQVTEDGLKVNFLVKNDNNIKDQEVEIEESEIFMICNYSEPE
ncbi:hypothetical protein [Facklamia hominis]|uniref:hypothetical protein n=1 Tax=Facklamia hominis TaxID=178214 RepID=UPI0038FC110C